MSLIVFTDLDGTLLDHSTYEFDAAKPALTALRSLDVPLVLATSKTAAEVAPLHARLQLGDVPAIVENGAGLFDPAATQPSETSAYDEIRHVLADLAVPEFKGFGDMTRDEVAEVTGLSPDAAALAKDRQFSEPGLWQGGDAELAAFQSALAERSIHSRHGGRFLTLSHGRNKADAMREVAKRYGAKTLVALGDAPNDVEMLEAADFGVIIRNDHAKPITLPEGEAGGRIRRSKEEGPVGWNTAVLEILDELGLGVGGAHG